MACRKGLPLAERLAQSAFKTPAAFDRLPPSRCSRRLQDRGSLTSKATWQSQALDIVEYVASY